MYIHILIYVYIYVPILAKKSSNNNFPNNSPDTIIDFNCFGIIVAIRTVINVEIGIDGTPVYTYIHEIYLCKYIFVNIYVFINVEIGIDGTPFMMNMLT
jgi:hypothetical protein